MGGFKDLLVYQKAFAMAMEIFELSKSFPPDERFALISQIRKSSRSVCSNLGEGYRKRQWVNHFLAKVSDADMENAETQVWLDFALSCNYITPVPHEELMDKSKRIGKLLHGMLKNPERFR